jgi:hypothetical protein
MNIQSSITSSGNTLLEVLQKSPGVVVNRQTGSIAMNGKSGVLVMIDGKVMQLPPDAVVGMLEGMSAANVEKIELITAPPAKYDAQGSAGMIHIITKGSAARGTNGSIGLTGGLKWAETLGGNASLNHQGKKLGWFLDYSINRSHNLHRMHMTRQLAAEDFTQLIKDESRRENITTQQNLSAGFEWKLSKHTSFTAGFAGYRRNWNLKALTTDTNQIAADSSISTRMQIQESNIWQSGSGGVGLQTKINDKSSLSLNLDYLYFHNDNPSSYHNETLYEQQQVKQLSLIHVNKTTPIRFLVGKADYQYQFSPAFNLEAGLKAVTSRLENDVQVQQEANGVWTPDPSFSSYASLREQVAAMYVSGNWQPGAAWQVNTGLRYEYTHTTISTPAQTNLVNRKYGYVFPSLSIRKNLNREMDLEFTYARRLTRPTYNDIAPYVFFWGPSSLSSGNTSLWPAVSDAIKLGYHNKQWVISMQFSHVQKEINGLQPEFDRAQNTLIYRSQNLKYLQTAGVTSAYSFFPAPWWEVQTNLTAQYQTARTSHLAYNTTIHLYGVNLNLVSLWKLPNNFSLEVSGMYQSRSLMGITTFGPMGTLNAGIKKIVQKVGTFQFSVDDLLYTNLWRIKAYSPQNNLDTNFYYDWHNQFIRLSFTRSIGKARLRSHTWKSGAEEERNRIAN